MDRNMEPIVILGGQGLVGTHLTRRIRAGHIVSRTKPQVPPSIDWVPSADMLEGRFHIPAQSVVISTWPIWLLPPVMQQMRGAKHIVALSSTSGISKRYSADPCDRDVAERILKAETRMVAAARADGLRYTILRPTLIYDEERDHSVNKIATILRRAGFFAVADQGCGLRQPIHAEDVAVAAWRALDNPAAMDQTLELTGGETIDYRTFVERIALGLGQRPRIVGVPSVVLRTAVLFMARFGRTSLTPGMIDRMNEDLIYDGSEARQRLGIEPRQFYPAFR